MKSRNFAIILYDKENEEDKKILEYIEMNYNYSHITHDKDITEDGEIKKEHKHIIIAFENAREISTVARDLQIEEHRIMKINSIKAQVRYLIHMNNPEKHQYQKEQIKTNMNIEKYFKDEGNETEEMKKILEYVYKADRYIFIHEVLEYALSEDMYSTYRRAGNQIIKIIQEHNNFYRRDI